MSARKSSHGTIFLIVSNGSPLALIASSLRSTSKKPVCPMTRSLHPPMAHCGQRVRFVATWREEFFKVPNSARRSHAIAAKRGHKGDGLPMPLRHTANQALAARATTTQPHHLGIGGGLVDEDQSSGIKHALFSHPAPARPRHVRALLLRCAQAFF